MVNHLAEQIRNVLQMFPGGKGSQCNFFWNLRLTYLKTLNREDSKCLAFSYPGIYYTLEKKHSGTFLLHWIRVLSLLQGDLHRTRSDRKPFLGSPSNL